MENKLAIIFDFDYTLADSSAAIVECFNYAFKSSGLPIVPPEKIYPLIGLSLPESFKILNNITVSDQVEELRGHFRTRGDQIALQMTCLYPETYEIIPALKAQGYRLGIVSTKYEYRIKAVLDREGMTAQFEEIVGGNDVEKHKPDPEGLQLILKRMNLSSEDAAYVGDSVADAMAARSAGIDFIGVLSGVTDRDALAEFNHVRILNSIKELGQIFMTKKREAPGT
jgi:phosphoglycolate phosphatase